MRIVATNEECTVSVLVSVAGRRRRVRVPPTMRLADLARICVGFDQAIAEGAARASRRDGNPVSCRAGCGACCRQVVPVSPPEAWMLEDVVRAMPPNRREAVLARFESARSTLEKRFDSRHPLIAIGDEYFALGIPCPFLENESCSIHPDRPTICREYLVTTPPELCTSTRSPIQFVPLPMRISESLAEVAAKVLGTAPSWIALTRALAWAVENHEDGARTWDSRYLVALAAEAFARSSGGSTGAA